MSLHTGESRRRHTWRTNEDALKDWQFINREWLHYDSLRPRMDTVWGGYRRSASMWRRKRMFMRKDR